MKNKNLNKLKFKKSIIANLKYISAAGGNDPNDELDIPPSFDCPSTVFATCEVCLFVSKQLLNC